MRQALPALLALLLFAAAAAHAQDAPAATPAFDERVNGTGHAKGFFDTYWDAAGGRMLLEVRDFDTDFLYVCSLASGVGSNPIGLDRGQLGETRIVRFERIGPKVLMVQPNMRFRSQSDDAAERRAASESFAQSVLAGFTVAAERDGSTLIDITDFLLTDMHGVSRRLRERKEGQYAVDPARSAVYLPRTRNFPDNTEFEVTLTLAGTDPGPELREVTPTPEALTVREHHSFVRLPDDGFEPRAYDPRTGYFPMRWRDYSAGLQESLDRRYIWRHRLQMHTVEDAEGGGTHEEVVEPIVYYLDPGTPEPVRGALIEGASWWAEAFEAAGFPGGFRVELLPEDADPMDVRYNVIEWVHRATRGWSYGASVIDPRTGEIIKGHVSLGSQRVRQDMLLAEALLSPFESSSTSEVAEQMALARLRQLAAHEVGHTLGLAHNFAASASDRASVMDYPFPLITIDETGELDFSKTYATGVGEWDRLAIMWGYGAWDTPAQEAAELERIFSTMFERGLTFISDPNARVPESAHPTAHPWDNGDDAAAELQRLLAVRRLALFRFSQNAIRPGTPVSELQRALVPLYLLHRYQTEAAVRLVGGRNFRHALRGDGEFAVEPVAAARQRTALTAVLRTIDPAVLTLPRGLAESIPPAPMGYLDERELFEHPTEPVFSRIGPAAAAVRITLPLLLEPHRLARAMEQHALDPEQLGAEDVINALVDATWNHRVRGTVQELIQHTVNWVTLEELMRLMVNEETHPNIAAYAYSAIDGIGSRLERSQAPFDRYVLAFIRRFLADPKADVIPPRPDSPPGDPIGVWMD